MPNSRSTSTRRQALKYTGLTGFSGLAGLTGLSLTSQPALALSEPVRLPTGLTEGTVNVSSYEIQYAELDTTSDITINYVLRTDAGTKTTESHAVSITEPTGVVMTGDHSISIPAGEVSLEVQLKHPSVGTVSTQEGTPTTVASAIPDSAIYWWDPSSFTTGDSVWTDEVANTDMSISGDPQKTTFSDGSDAISGDGTDDSGQAPQSDILTALSSGAFEAEVQFTTTARTISIGAFDGTQLVYLEVNSDGDFNNSTGNIAFYVRDNSENYLSIAAGTSNLNDGSVHDVSVSVNDASTNDIEIIVDGTTESTTPVYSDGPSNFASFSPDVAYWARNNQGTIDDFTDTSLGTIAWHDQPINSQTI